MTTRKVLLVDADVNALGALASALRARGVTVFNASEVFDAVEEAFRARPDVVLFADQVIGENDLRAAFLAVPELAHTPLLHLFRDDTGATTAGPGSVPRADLDQIVSRIAAVAPRVERPVLDQEISGNLEQMPLGDLLQFLSMNRRSGVLSITTARGSGEVHLAEGDVIDASYRRLDGEKALYRLFGEPAGRFAFQAGEAAKTRRISSPTGQLLMESMRQVDEGRRRRTEFTPAGEALVLDEPPTLTSAGRNALSAALGLNKAASGNPVAAVGRELAVLLQIPRSLDEILDHLKAPDLVILEALGVLFAGGKMRRVPLVELTTPFAPPEALPVLCSLVTRLTRAGFDAPPRLVIAAESRRFAALANAIRRIADAVAPPEVAPTAAIPRLLGTLRLGDGVELALLGLPTEDAFSPTWPLALPGVAAVVRVHGAGGAALEAHCTAVETMLIDADSLMSAINLASPRHVAGLVRAALEMAAGV
jgi:hypothetical protein